MAAMLDRAATHRTVPAGGGGMAWRGWGEGRPVVLLHGGHGSWTHWCRNVQPLVEAGRQVWAPDLPGFGDSPALPGVEDADGLVAPLADALDTLFPQQDVDVVAFSFGAIVAGLLARERPRSTARLVLVGATGLGLVTPPPPLQSWRKAVTPGDRLRVHGDNLAVLMLHSRDAADGEAAQLQAANVERTRLASLRLSHSDVLLQALQSVDCPVHGIWGEHDALYRGQLPRVQAAFRSLPTGGRFAVIPRAGHWVQYEAPAAFHAALCEALAER